jgi:alpha-aminoadipate carrier protein LysW
MFACPVCEAEVSVTPSVIVSELVDCGECSTELEVASLTPPLLREAPMEEEDWGE